MAIKKREDVLANRKIEIDLTGPDGNVFVVWSIARRFYIDQTNAGECFEFEGKEIESVDELMKILKPDGGDYEDVISRFDAIFGEWFDLLR